MKYRKIQFFEYQKGVDIISSTLEGAIADVNPKYYNETPHKCVREMILAEDENGNWDVVKETWFDEE